MRIVLDTNVTVSGLLWSGPPRRILGAARAGSIRLFVDAELLSELADVLRRDKFAPRFVAAGKSGRELIDDYTALVEIVSPLPLPAAVSVDPDDDAVLACAVAAQAEVIVTGDDHLLRLSVYQGIAILTAPALLARITSQMPK